MNTFDQQGRTPTTATQGPTTPQATGPRRDELRGLSYEAGQQALSPSGGTVERHEAADPRLGAVSKPVDVSVAPTKADEGKPAQLKAEVRDPDAPGQTSHLWFQWKQTGGPHVESTTGQFRQNLEFLAPPVRGDQQVVGEVTVTKRGHLGVQGLSTTQRFAVAVRDVGEPPPAVQQTMQAASPNQQAQPGTLPSMALLLPWLQALQAAQPPTQQRQPQPPVVSAPDQAVVTAGDRAVLKASASDPEASRQTPGSLQITWTQESGAPMGNVQGQGTPSLSFKAPDGGQQVIAGKVAAVAKDGRRAEDKFSVKVQPKVAANETGRVWGDPHFVGGDGETYDIMGRDGGVYQILSDQGVQLNAKFKKWAGTNITVVDHVGGVITFQDASGKLQRSEVYFESGMAKLDGQALPRGKSTRLADGGSALFLSNGDLIIDTREGYKVTLHSQGSGNRRYVDFEVQTGARGVGDGAEPGGLLGQTFDADKVAKNGRKGDGAQGEGTIQGVVQDYEVTGGVFGTPKPGKAAPQPLSARSGRPLQRSTVLVAANPTELGLEGFVDSGVDVSPGDEILVKASGSAGEAGRLTRKPDGDARYTHPQKANFLCGAAPAFALVGRIGGGASFMVGSNHRSVAPAGGRLLLGFNDLKGTFRDNTGEYLADVQVLKGVTAEAEAPAPTPPATVQRANAQAQAQQNLAALTGILGTAMATGGQGSQQAVPWQPQAAARTETTASMANPWAALLATLAAAKPATATAPATQQKQPFLPGRGAPQVPQQSTRPPWLPQTRVLARPVVEAPAPKTLQSGERGRLQTRVTDPDQGKLGGPRIEWRQESGPRLENLTGQGTPDLQFTAPQTTQRTTATGAVTATDADGLRAEAKFAVSVEPRIAASERGRVWGDPHFVGGDGEKYDIMGRPGGIYNILQDAGLRVTALFKRYNSNNITVMDRCGVTLTGSDPKGGTKRNDVEFTPTGATVDGKALARGQMVHLADGGSALFLGDRLVVDTREGYKLTFWPRKSGAISYVDLDVDTGARGTGSDGDAEGLLGQTFDADKVAKHGKTGANAQGEGAIKGVVGDYELTGGLFGKTRDGKAAPEAAKSEQRLVRRTVLVAANPGKGAEGFVDTGLEVNAGDKVIVRASGSASEAGGRLTRTPDGDARYTHPRKADFMGPAAPAFGLVARVASEPKGFHVGSAFQGAAQKKGRLELAFNDLAGTYGDNKGEYVADVQVVREVV